MGVTGTCMHIHDGRMVDEPCTRKHFLEKWRIQRLETQVFWWMDTLLYILQQAFFMIVGMRRSWKKNEEYQRSKKTEDVRRNEDEGITSKEK